MNIIYSIMVGNNNLIGIKSSIHKNKRIYLDTKNKMIFYKIIENKKIKIQDEYKYKFTNE